MMKRLLLVLSLPLVACGSGDDDDGTNPPIQASEYAALVRGTLFTSDFAAAQARHDMLAAGGEAQAKAAGDFGHDVGLGSGLLGSTSSTSFFAVDRWNNADAMNGFYANPDFAAGFAELFDGQPTIETFERQQEWHSWGDLDAGEGGERWIVVVRGTLAAATVEERKAGHDMAAAGGEAMVRAAGDVAHVAYTGLQDDREFLAFDVWTNSDAIEAVYTDPNFQAAFSMLFSAPPTLQIYEISDWHQW